MPEYTVVTKKVEAMQIAALRDVVENYREVGPLFQELFAEIGKTPLAPTGPSFAMYYDEGYKEIDVDVEVAVPVHDGKAKLTGRVKARKLEGEQVASLTRVGPYDDFTPAYQALMDWIKANGYRINGPNREIYLIGPEANIPPEQYVTELQFPITKS